MAEIWTMGETLVEIMRTKENSELYRPDYFKGPYPSGAPAIFIDTVARLGHKCGIISGVGQDDFGKCILDRLKKDGVDVSQVLIDRSCRKRMTANVNCSMYRRRGWRLRNLYVLQEGRNSPFLLWTRHTVFRCGDMISVRII